jgi:hypothetical protein
MLATSISVGAQSTALPRDTTYAIETPKIPSFGFNPAFFCQLTLVPQKRVLGVPLASETCELMESGLNRNALTIIKFNCASFNNG